MSQVPTGISCLASLTSSYWRLSMAPRTLETQFIFEIRVQSLFWMLLQLNAVFYCKLIWDFFVLVNLLPLGRCASWHRHLPASNHGSSERAVASLKFWIIFIFFRTRVLYQEERNMSVSAVLAPDWENILLHFLFCLLLPLLIPLKSQGGYLIPTG